MAATLDSNDQHSRSDAHFLIQVGRTVWENLALLLFTDVVLVLAALPVLFLGLSGLLYPALLLVALLCGPVWASIVATSDQLNRGSEVSVSTFVSLLRRHALRGMGVSMVLMLLVAAFAVTVDAIGRYPEATWIGVFLLLECSLAIIVAASSVAVFSLATTGGLRGWNLWRASLAVGIANPLATAGSLALLVVLMFLVNRIGLVLLAVIPAPCAVLFSAITWSTVERHESARVDQG